MAKSINAMWNESMAKGRAEEKDRIIKNMINLGYSDDHIAAAVDLPVSKIAEIRSSIK